MGVFSQQDPWADLQGPADLSPLESPAASWPWTTHELSAESPGLPEHVLRMVEIASLTLPPALPSTARPSFALSLSPLPLFSAGGASPCDVQEVHVKAH